jgi:hypothetical protein
MAFFHIFIHGEHFLLDRDGKAEWQNFFKNVYVEADTADEAEGFAVQRVVTDPAFRASVKNPADKPPTLSIAETNPIEKNAALVDSDFQYFPDDAPPA